MCAFPKDSSVDLEQERRRRLRRLAREVNAKAGVPDPSEITITVEELRAMQVARGLRPEDNEGSRELMRMRYGDDWEEGE